MSENPTYTPLGTPSPTALPSPTAQPAPIATPPPNLAYQTVNATPCYINLQVINNQPISTASQTFHVQLIQLAHTTIVSYCSIADVIGATNLALYVYFVDGISNTIANSWYERFDGTYHYWWVRLSTSINANTAYPITMYIMNYPVINGTTIGASPWWTSNAYGWTPYMNMDNGHNVFHWYYNWQTLNSQVLWSGVVYAGGSGGWVDFYNTVQGFMILGNNCYEGKGVLSKIQYPQPFPVEVLVGWWYVCCADGLSISYSGNPSSYTCVYCQDNCYGCGGDMPVEVYSAYIQYELYSGTCGAPYGNPVVLASPSTSGSYNCAVAEQFFTPASGQPFYMISRYEFSGTSLTGGYTTSLIGGIPSAPLPSMWNTIPLAPTSIVAAVTSQWGATLFIGAGSGGWRNFIYLNWVTAFDYPPNGAMPAVTTVSAGTLG